MLDLFLPNSKGGWGSSGNAVAVLPVLRPRFTHRASLLGWITTYTSNSFAFIITLNCLSATPTITQPCNGANKANIFPFSVNLELSNSAMKLGGGHFIFLFFYLTNA